MRQGEGAVLGVRRPHCFGGANRHFQVKRTKYSNVHIMETTACIPTKFCVAVKPPNMRSGWSSNV